MSKNSDMASEIREMTTDRLDKILQKAGTDAAVNQYVEKYARNQYESFSDYFNEYISKGSLEIPDIIYRSNISKNYIYNIINGKRNPGRDKIISLCIGAGMNLREINRGLKIGRYSALYAKDERDARIIVAVNQGIRSVIDLNIILEKHGLNILE